MAEAPQAITASDVGLFVERARAVAATVVCVGRQSEALSAALVQAVADAPSVVIAESPYVTGIIRSAFPPGCIIDDPRDEQLATAQVGITEAFAGVSSTGSVCIELGRSMTAVASLLMPLHIVLLPVERIVSRPRNLFDLNCGVRTTGSFVFVTGPSATADMGPLVRGVHGPHRLHILVLEA